jgi:hypothetical protein
MSYTNPDINAGAQIKIGLDAPIEEIRTAIGSLSWISKSFGRAWEFKEKGLTSGKTIRVPKVYEAAGEYINVLPNDNLFSAGIAASSFIAVREAEKYSNYQPFTGSIKQTRLSLIIWANLKLIDETKDYIFTEELKKQIEDKIKVLPSVTEIIEWVDERAEDVFKGYDVNGGDFDMQYLMYPYAGIRVDFNIQYPESC